MRAVNLILVPLGLLAAAVACAPQRTAYSDLPPLRLGARFGLENVCEGSQSPPIAVVGAPQGVTAYRVRLSNVSVLLQTPREWQVAAGDDPARIPIGALEGYSGPCPGEFQRFTYRIELLALDRTGAALAYGRDDFNVDSINTQAQQAWRRARDGRAPDPAVPPSVDADFRDVFPRRDRDLDLFPERNPAPGPLGPLALPTTP